MNPWVRNAFLTLALLLAPVAAAPVALAEDTCPITDPTCIIDDVGGTGDDVAGTGDDVAGTGDDVGDTVGGVGDTVNDGAGTVVDQVEGQVDGVLGGGGGPEPPGGGGPPGSGGGEPPGGGGGGGGAGGGDGQEPPGGSGGGHRSTGGLPASRLRIPGATPLEPVIGLSDATPDAFGPQATAAPSLPQRIGRITLQATKGLTLLVALFGIVLGFVTIQDRLDKKDPKLALAPAESDVLRFA